MKQPRIGLTIGPFQDSAIAYRRALEAAGLQVFVMSSADVCAEHPASAARLLDHVDGVLLAGGGDIDPHLIGSADAHHPSVYGVDPNRDVFERAVFEEAWRRGMPLFAICRGMQLMNWALGGTLCPDIDAFHEPRGVPKRHRQTDLGHTRGARTHSISLARPSLLYDIVECDRLSVNSIHHQSLGRVADGLRVSALADDGVIEAVESADRDFVLGVQFHPEEVWADEAVFLRLFERFGQAALRRLRTDFEKSA